MNGNGNEDRVRVPVRVRLRNPTLRPFGPPSARGPGVWQDSAAAPSRVRLGLRAGALARAEGAARPEGAARAVAMGMACNLV